MNDFIHIHPENRRNHIFYQPTEREEIIENMQKKPSKPEPSANLNGQSAQLSAENINKEIGS
jgi:hypothetical protein